MSESTPRKSVRDVCRICANGFPTKKWKRSLFGTADHMDDILREKMGGNLMTTVTYVRRSAPQLRVRKEPTSKWMAHDCFDYGRQKCFTLGSQGMSSMLWRDLCFKQTDMLC